MSKMPDFLRLLGADDHDIIKSLDKTIDGLLNFIVLDRRISYSQDTEEMVEHRDRKLWVDGLLEANGYIRE